MLYYTSSSDDEPEIESLNTSNDQYYRPVYRHTSNFVQKTHKHSVQGKSEESSLVKSEKPVDIPIYGSSKIRHTLPAYDLWRRFYPTHLSRAKLRTFHRPKLRHYNNGPQAVEGRYYPEFPVNSLSRHLHRTRRSLRSKVIKAIDDGKLSRDEIQERFLRIKKARELTAKTGELYLFEYSEEFPPVLSQVGMSSTIVTYRYSPGTKAKGTLKCKSNKVTPSNLDNVEPPRDDTLQESRTAANLGYQEEVKSEKHARQIYFHPMKPHSSIRVIENNLYRAPIYSHKFSENDFIVIRTRNSFYIRPADGIFTVGQTMPLAIVPPPTEAHIQKFRLDLSNVYMHKLFMASTARPRSLNIDHLKKLFPDYHPTVLPRRLRCARAFQTVMKNETVFVQGDSIYGRVPLRDLRKLVKPETYCVNVSMLAARQRLSDLNYSESMIYPIKGQSSEHEREVLAAPWNTSKAVISALRGQIYLDFEGHLIDPTGSREGFSCVPWPKSPLQEQQLNDLRTSATSKPPLGGNTEMPSLNNPLRNKIVQEKLSRLATYQKKAQHIFEIQSKSLSIQDPLTSDEDEDEGEGDEGDENISEACFNQQLADLNELVIGCKSTAELSYQREEEVRRQMLSDFKVDDLNNRSKSNLEDQPKTNADDLTALTMKGKLLLITRTYVHQGERIERTEIVREPRIIALYAKQRCDPTMLEAKKLDLEQSSCDEGDWLNSSVMSSKSEGAQVQNRVRPRASSLGPSELCRADGMILRISKKVLDQCRPLRQCRR